MMGLRGEGDARQAERKGIGIGYTLATGRLFCDVSDFHEYAEKLLARPVWTHEFAVEATWVEMRERYESLVAELGTVPRG